MKKFLYNTYHFIQKCLMSEFVTPIILYVSFMLWLTDNTYLSVFIMAALVSLILIFCDKVNNIFAPIFYVSFFINDISVDANVLYYGIAIGIAILSIIFFITKTFIKRRKELKKGKLFYAFIIMTVALMLSGVIGHFRLWVMFVMLGSNIVAYMLYWIAINCCDNLKDYLFKLAIYGAIAISVVIVTLNALNGNFFKSIIFREVVWIGAQNINVAAIFISLGIISCFGLGYKKKYDWALYTVSVPLLTILIITYCRIIIFLTAPIYIFLLVLTIVKSPRKLNFIWATIGIVATAGLLFWAFKDPIYEIFESLVMKTKAGSNGRQELWAWCWQKFIENPIFGFGYLSDEYIPNVRNFVPVVQAHNTILQWLTCLGAFGTLCMLYFYFRKYQIVFTRFNMQKMFVMIEIVIIELSGIVDQAASIDIFVVILTYIFTAVCEVENNKNQLLNPIKVKRVYKNKKSEVIS